MISIQKMTAAAMDRDLAAQLDRLAHGLRPLRLPKAGSMLVREYEGVIDEGRHRPRRLSRNGQTFNSLSTVARRITGESLLSAIAKARRWMGELVDGAAASTDAITLREEMGERNIRKLLPLACLSPAVIRVIADGLAPADLTIRQLTSALPHDWAQQEQKLLIG